MSEADDHEHVALLREKGLHVTHQRLAIFKALLNSASHMTAEEIHQQIRKSFPMISLGTVYKNLEKLHEKGVIQRVRPFWDAARYEIAAGPHHHIVCVKCQAIVDIRDPIAESGLSLPEGHGYQIFGHDILVQGRCPGCAE
jgi:Fur family peroxide stress response transcriptional regulator